MPTLIKTNIAEIATEVARALVRITTREESARLSLPLLYPGGSMVGVEISKVRDAFLVSDAGAARREAGLMGGERSFAQLAPDVAIRYGVHFDHCMFFEINVERDDLVVAVSAIANASKAAVEATAMRLATVEHADYQAMLWETLERIFTEKRIAKTITYKGKSEEWDFDAAVQFGKRLSLFEVVTPYASSVNGVVTKFVDITALGDSAPNRIAILTNAEKTPHFAVLTSIAKWIPANANDATYKQAVAA
jgi:hypothetical protein